MCLTCSSPFIVASQLSFSMMNFSRRCTTLCSRVQPCLTKEVKNGISIQTEIAKRLTSFFLNYTGLAKRKQYSMCPTTSKSVYLVSSMDGFASTCHMQPIANSLTWRRERSCQTTKTFGLSHVYRIQPCLSLSPPSCALKRDTSHRST